MIKKDMVIGFTSIFYDNPDLNNEGYERNEMLVDYFIDYMNSTESILSKSSNLQYTQYGNDIELILFQFEVFPHNSIIEHSPKIENYRAKEKSIGIPVIITQENFFDKTKEEQINILRDTILAKLTLLRGVVAKKRLDTNMDKLTGDVELAFGVPKGYQPNYAIEGADEKPVEETSLRQNPKNIFSRLLNLRNVAQNSKVSLLDDVAEDDEEENQQAIIITIPYASKKQLGTKEEQDKLYELEQIISNLIEDNGFDYDGNDTGEGVANLYCYGEDADEMFYITKDALSKSFFKGITVTKRYGTLDDINLLEVEMKI